jgi:hypothetical protein
MQINTNNVLNDMLTIYVVNRLHFHNINGECCVIVALQFLQEITGRFNG